MQKQTHLKQIISVAYPEPNQEIKLEASRNKSEINLKKSQANPETNKEHNPGTY